MVVALKGWLRRRCEAGVCAQQQASPWEKSSIHLPNHQPKPAARESLPSPPPAGNTGKGGENPAPGVVLDAI